MTDPFYDLLPFLFCTLLLMGAVGWLLGRYASKVERWINK